MSNVASLRWRLSGLGCLLLACNANWDDSAVRVIADNSHPGDSVVADAGAPADSDATAATAPAELEPEPEAIGNLPPMRPIVVDQGMSVPAPEPVVPAEPSEPVVQEPRPQMGGSDKGTEVDAGLDVAPVPEPDTVQGMTFEDVRRFMDTPIDSQATCFDCHKADGCYPMVFQNDDTLYETLTTHTSQACDGRKLVEPGDPENSALYLLLTTESCGRITQRMPFGCVEDQFQSNCANPAQIEALRLWIENGAPE